MSSNTRHMVFSRRIDSLGFRGFFLALLSMLAVSACGDSASTAGGGNSGLGPTDPPPSEPPPSQPPPGPVPPGCAGIQYDSTYDAVQQVVFDRNCVACHSGDTPSGSLDLSAGASFDNIFQRPSLSSELLLVRPGDREGSHLWRKVAAWTDDSIRLTGGSAMPPQNPVDDGSYDLLRFWISTGAPGPDEGVVVGTAELVEGCGPPPNPTQIEPLEAPEPGTGVQLQMPTYILDASSEVEICFCTYFDVRDQVPDEFKTPDERFLFWDRSEIRQTNSSHHLLIQTPTAVFAGEDFDPHTYSGWACRGGAAHGSTCDPLGSDCGAGVCATPVENTTACAGYDAGNGTVTATFAGTQTSQSKTNLHPGVYQFAPTSGVVCWNSHAFNLTTQDTEMNARLNYHFAEDRRYLSRGINTSDTFAVLELIRRGASAYTKNTLCWERTLPRGARVTSFSSHNHEKGERAWWTLPNGEVAYENLTYNDPPEIFLEEPLKFDAEEDDERTLEFCITYNNGVDENGNPDPETVTRASRIEYGLGGPGSVGLGMCEPYACANLGADFTINCDDDERNQAGNDSLCDTSPGAGDGLCDACSITGGVTTENEMGQGSIQFFVLPVEE